MRKFLSAASRVLLWSSLSLAAWPCYAEGEWQAPALKTETIEKIHAQTQNYHQCMGQELLKFTDPAADPRNIADAVLKICEAQLTPMREAFVAEGVPEAQADRYLRRVRTQAANNLLRETMMMQAQRQAGAAP